MIPSTPKPHYKKSSKVIPSTPTPHYKKSAKVTLPTLMTYHYQIIIEKA